MIYRDPTGITMKSNSPEGDSFLMSMLDARKQREKLMNLFVEFIENHFNISHWHFHDGWVKYGRKSGKDVLSHDRITLTWVPQHTGSHSFTFPCISDKIAIINNFVYDDSTPVSVFVYKVMSESRPFSFNEYTLHYLDKFELKFTAKGSFSIKPMK